MTAGLEGVIAAETLLSQVNGKDGQLIIRGHHLEELAFELTFEDMIALLRGASEAGPCLTPVALGRARCDMFERVPAVCKAADGLSLADGLRTGLSMIARGPENPLEMLAALPVFIAALWRVAQGQEPVAPDAQASQAADFLSMLTGRQADPARVRALDTYLVTVADHGMNASTFTARVVASTGAGTVAGVVAALGALSGPLHGGAPGPVLDMLLEVGTADNMRPWVERRLRDGHRMMGFGHRIYRTRDPRADVLKEALARLRKTARDPLPMDRLSFAEDLERVVIRVLASKYPDRRLDTNVEYFTALLLEAIGLHRDLFTPVFAMGRVAGWIAHIDEQARSGRILRPASLYTGPMPQGTDGARVAAG